jgi:FkbM family methyltransferase
MKNKIKKALKSLLGPLNRRLGYVLLDEADFKIDPHGKDGLLKNFYTVLKEINFTPSHIVDVGANHGTWTREALRYFPDAYFTLLEPQYWMKDSIKDLLDTNNKVRFHAVGAGEKAGSFRFTLVDRDDSCSFIYTEEEARQRGFRQIEVPVVTLNDFLGDQNTPLPDIIKIDAEGLDISVLKGASHFFGRTEVFMAEAGVVCKTIPNNFLEVINFMDQNGYRLFEITDLNRPFKPTVLWLTELVFVKKNGVIDAKTFY